MHRRMSRSRIIPRRHIPRRHHLRPQLRHIRRRHHLRPRHRHQLRLLLRRRSPHTRGRQRRFRSIRLRAPRYRSSPRSKKRAANPPARGRTGAHPGCAPSKPAGPPVEASSGDLNECSSRNRGLGTNALIAPLRLGDEEGESDLHLARLQTSAPSSRPHLGDAGPVRPCPTRHGRPAGGLRRPCSGAGRSHGLRGLAAASRWRVREWSGADHGLRSDQRPSCSAWRRRRLRSLGRRLGDRHISCRRGRPQWGRRPRWRRCTVAVRLSQSADCHRAAGPRLDRLERRQSAVGHDPDPLGSLAARLDAFDARRQFRSGHK
jgi:hypothetical protein